MALRIRIRKDSRGKWKGHWNPHKEPIIIVCAADQGPKKQDIYIDDNLHYFLANVVKVIYTTDEGKTWYFKKV